MVYSELPDLVQKALLIGAKFGYINKKIYLEHAGRLSVSYKYRIWNELYRLKLVVPYLDESFSENYFYLSKKARLMVIGQGIAPVVKVQPIYFSHDNAVMKFALVNESFGQILDDWQTEASLRLLDNYKLQQIFNGQLGKFPDLLATLNIAGQKIKIAIEVERSAKNQSRYDSFAMGYSKAKGVDLVLVAHGYKFTREALLVSMRRIGYPRSVRPMAFCDFSDFVNHPSSFEFELEAHRISFPDYIKNVQRLVHENVQKSVENSSTYDSTKN